MIKIDNEFIINAKASEIWDVITQVDKYGDWNSFVSECECNMVVGDAIKMKVHLLPFPINQKETVLEYEPGVIFNYGVNLPFNLLKSTRKHTVETIDENQVRYRSEFRLQGLLSPIVSAFMSSKLQQGFNRMSDEMKAEVLRRQS